MNIQRMQRAELIALIEQLNEARDHTDRVIDGLRVELEQAYFVLGAAKLGIKLPGTRDIPTVGRVRDDKLVHEFDPSTPGSYVQAMQRAREQGGVVRRARS